MPAVIGAGRPLRNVSFPVTMLAGKKESRRTKPVNCRHKDHANIVSISSKRKGLEKALHQIEQAIKRPKSDASESDAAQKIISSLQDLLNRTQGNQLYSETDELSEDTDRPHYPHSPHGVDTGDSLSLDDAENPLQLLARASDLQLPPAEVRSFHGRHPLEPSQPAALPQNNNAEDDSSTAKLFFVPVKANLDLGSDMDPIELGLVTPDEASSLFALYDHISIPESTCTTWAHVSV